MEERDRDFLASARKQKQQKFGCESHVYDGKWCDNASSVIRDSLIGMGTSEEGC